MRQTQSGQNVREIRCKGKNCTALLGLENIHVGVIEIKCSKCSTVNEIAFRATRAELEKAAETLKERRQ